MTITQALVRIGKILRGKMVAHLNRTTHGTGALAKSISYKVTEEGTTFNLVRTMNAYGNYLDSGVRGTRNTKGIPNAESLFNIGQFKSKSISPSSGLPFPVRYVIARDGIRPNPFMVPAIGATMNENGLDLLARAGADEVIYLSDKNLKDVKITA